MRVEICGYCDLPVFLHDEARNQAEPSEGCWMLPCVQGAIGYAKDGPRVSAIVRSMAGDLVAVPGFMDGDTELTKQLALVTPDGRIWWTDEIRAQNSVLPHDSEEGR